MESEQKDRQASVCNARNCSVLVLVLALLVGLFVFIGHQPSCLHLTCSMFKYDCPAVQIRGKVEPGFEEVRDLFQKNFVLGKEIGSTLSVYFQGEEVVSLSGGFKDKDEQKEIYDEETLNMVFSSTKVMTSICIALLEDRGLLSYQDKISKHWPEFAQNGKEDITVSDLMTHAAGLLSFNETIVADEVFGKDGWEEDMAEFLAAQQVDPLWKEMLEQKQKKRMVGYHAITRGFYASQIIRKVDPKKRTMGQFVLEEIARPLNVDFFVGNLPDSKIEKLSPMYVDPTWKVVTNSLPRLFLPHFLSSMLYQEGPDKEGQFFMSSKLLASAVNALVPSRSSANGFTLDIWNHPITRKTESPSTSGITNARSIAKIACALASGKVLSRSGMKRSSKLMDLETDVLLGLPIQYAQAGWGRIPRKGLVTDGWAGAGGSIFQFSEDLQLGFGYVMNYYQNGLQPGKGFELLEATIRCIKGKK